MDKISSEIEDDNSVVPQIDIPLSTIRLWKTTLASYFRAV